jgi:hypothetical protein
LEHLTRPNLVFLVFPFWRAFKCSYGLQHSVIVVLEITAHTTTFKCRELISELMFRAQKSRSCVMQGRIARLHERRFDPFFLFFPPLPIVPLFLYLILLISLYIFVYWLNYSHQYHMKENVYSNLFINMSSDFSLRPVCIGQIAIFIFSYSVLNPLKPISNYIYHLL